MAENRIQYNARNFDDFKTQILSLTQKYYPHLLKSYDDAAIGTWLIELYASIGDELSYHMDRVFQETSIDSAQTYTSLFNIARTNGVKVPGRKSAVVEIELSCNVPVDNTGNLSKPDEMYMPLVKRGTKFTDGRNIFELQQDLNFAEQFSYDGISDRQIYPRRDNNGITGYTIKKLGIAVAGEYHIFRKMISPSEIQPFMEFQLNDGKLLGVESIIFKEGIDLGGKNPDISEFFVDAEEYYENPIDSNSKIVRRYFECDSLIDQYRFGDVVEIADVGTDGVKKQYCAQSDTIYAHENVYSDATNNTISREYCIQIAKSWLKSTDLGQKEDFDKTFNSLVEYCDSKTSTQPTYTDWNVTEAEYNNIKDTIDSVVESLTDALNSLPQASVNSTNKNDTPIQQVVKGKWKRLKNKYITEWTDDWHLKVIFGAGIRNQYGSIPESAQLATQYFMSRMNANDYMGVLPDPGTTMFVLYRTGGGEETNIAAYSLNSIAYLDVGMVNCPDDVKKMGQVYRSFTVTNPSPSYGGKDEPSIEELRYLIKYASSTQNRCVTVDDYYARLNQMPPRYGVPFRFAVTEENNKICIYCLGMDSDKHLTPILSETVANNLSEYLSKYRMINDYVEFRSGKVVNLSFDVYLFIDRNYDKSEVVKRAIDTIYDYMDIRKHQMGEDIFLGDLEKTISQLDGVVNVSKMLVSNETDTTKGYSSDTIAQPFMLPGCCPETAEISDAADIKYIDLAYSDNILFGDSSTMYEIRNKNTDIRIKVKLR